MQTKRLISSLIFFFAAIATTATFACEYHVGGFGGWSQFGGAHHNTFSAQSTKTDTKNKIALKTPTVLTVKKNKAFELPVSFQYPKTQEKLTIELGLEMDQSSLLSSVHRADFFEASGEKTFQITPVTKGMHLIRVIARGRTGQLREARQTIYVKVE